MTKFFKNKKMKEEFITKNKTLIHLKSKRIEKTIGAQNEFHQESVNKDNEYAEALANKQKKHS